MFLLVVGFVCQAHEALLPCYGLKTRENQYMRLKIKFLKDGNAFTARLLPTLRKKKTNVWGSNIGIKVLGKVRELWRTNVQRAVLQK